jgi:hypothetical protein
MAKKKEKSTCDKHPGKRRVREVERHGDKENNG